jgi:hypothetical protein
MVRDDKDKTWRGIGWIATVLLTVSVGRLFLAIVDNDAVQNAFPTVVGNSLFLMVALGVSLAVAITLHKSLTVENPE